MGRIRILWQGGWKVWMTIALFIGLFASMAVYYYHSFIDEGPLSSHMWRQCDCLSMTSRYAAGTPLMEPEMHRLDADEHMSGKSAGEFPILYFIAGKMWQAWGESYMSYRLFYLLIMFAALYAFFRSLYRLIQDSFWAVTISLLLFTSPVLAFYGISFLTDAPAFFFVLIGLSLILGYYRKRSGWIFLTAMAFFALGGLVKVSSMIAFIILGIFFLLELAGAKSLGNRKLFSHSWLEWAGFLGVLILVVSWYLYTDRYNTLHNFKYTFNTIHPAWLLGWNSIREVLIEANWQTLTMFFSRPVVYLLMLVWGFNILQLRKLPLLAGLSSLLVLPGVLAYAVLWLPLLGNHDYYFIAMLILFPGIFLPFLYYLKAYRQAWLGNRWVKLGMAIFLFYNIVYCGDVLRVRTLAEKGHYPIVMNMSFVRSVQSINIDVAQKYGGFRTIRPYLDKAGISADSKVISLPDPTINASLYLMDRQGWTGYAHDTTRARMDYLISKGAAYLFIGDDELLGADYLQPYLHELVGVYEGIRIFRLTQPDGL